MARRRRVLLFLCCMLHVALFLSPPLVVPTRALSSRRVTLARAPPRKRLALIMHGRQGGVDWTHHIKYREYEWAPDERAVALAWPLIQRNIIDFNAQAGYTTDVFFHTWDALAAEAVARVVNATAWSAGPVLLNGHRLTSDAWPSAEVAMMVMKQFNRDGRRGGRPGYDASQCHFGAPDVPSCGGAWDTSAYLAPAGYDRVLVTRFDTSFYIPFELEKLANPDALYVANWCKAIGGAVPTPPPFRSCRFLEHFLYDLGSGLPDFYFAGSEEVMWALYAWWHLDAYIPRFVPLSAPPNHGIVRGRVNYVINTVRNTTVLRRYQFHDIDITLVRNAFCMLPRFALAAAGNWSGFERGDTDVTTDSDSSLCIEGARYYCGLTENEMARGPGCGAFQWE